MVSVVEAIYWIIISVLLVVGIVGVVYSAMTKCPNGHIVTNSKAEFCQKCGAKLKIFCPNGHKAEYEDKFCPKCGAKINEKKDEKKEEEK